MSAVSWKPHILALLQKVKRNIGISYLNTDNLINIFRFLVVSHLRYCITSSNYGYKTFVQKFFFFYLLFIFYYIGIRIIDNGASRRRTRNARFRARRADHSTTSMCSSKILKTSVTRLKSISSPNGKKSHLLSIRGFYQLQTAKFMYRFHQQHLSKIFTTELLGSFFFHSIQR